MKKIFQLLFVVSLGITAIVASSSNSDAKPGNNGQQSYHSVLKIPSHAVEVVPGKLFWLGTAREKGKLVEGYAIIHRGFGFGKPSGCNYDGTCQGWESASCSDCTSGGDSPDPTTSDCFGYLGNGAKWRLIENVNVDPENVRGLLGPDVLGIIEWDIGVWEDAADGAVDNIYLNIMGDVVAGGVDGADMTSPDDFNEVYFADIEESGVIGITIVWGIFRGPPKSRELVEFDMVFDDVSFDWSIDCESESCTTKMDFENIAIHEIGHAFGLDDLYTNSCSEETMYGYATEGEIAKRSLELGDITGIYQLYK